MNVSQLLVKNNSDPRCPLGEIIKKAKLNQK